MIGRELKRLTRWLSLRWRLKARYWRRRAIYAEQQLKAETWRNRAREDELITVPQRLQGLWGMPPRTEPALATRQTNPRPALTRSADPWEALSWADKREYDLEWKEAAVAKGISEPQARQMFLAELASRRIPINDDPFSAN
jgi:hypothetical protein